MTNTLALTASMLLLMTISGHAFAATQASADQQAVYAATTYHYHGGPKNND
jgi:hypothetical protein